MERNFCVVVNVVSVFLSSFRSGAPTECVSDCSAALDLSPDYAKALFRRLRGYEQLGLLDMAS